MNNQYVRIHLRQNIMVGHGNESRYAKVLTGIRQHGLDERLSNGEQLLAFTVNGYVTGGINNFHIQVVKPHKMLLAGNNILSIEDMAIEEQEHPEQPTAYRCPACSCNS